MSRVKNIRIKPIKSKDANRIIKKLHYSGKVTPNSQVHFGIFLDGKCGGAIQYGPSLDKSKIRGLVKGTGWNDFMEINRMATAEWMPKNTESRSLSVSLKILRKEYPHLKWIISYADATQSGDGAIYRACGFVLTKIKKNDRLYKMPDGRVAHGINMTDSNLSDIVKENGWKGGETEKEFVERIGAEPLTGFQLRYIYFLDEDYRDRLTVEGIPYDKIDEYNAGMYKGEKVSYAERNKS